MSLDLGALARALAKACADWRANSSRPAEPSAPLTAEQLEAALAAIEARLPACRAWIAAHPGALTSADDMLDYLAGQGVPWAAALKTGVDALPHEIAEGEEYIHDALALLAELSPAPTYQDGPGPYRGR